MKTSTQLQIIFFQTVPHANDKIWTSV